MGDPRHTREESYHVGTSRGDGMFPRLADQRLTAFESIGQTYCDDGDTFCDSGASTAVHLGYTRKYNDKALAFVLDKIGG
jgi:acetylxylan esterase